MAMKAGFKCSRLSNSLKENILELKWNRNADAQRLVKKLLEEVDDCSTIDDVEKIDQLMDIVNADKIIKDTPHTFNELWEGESDGIEL